LRLGATCVTLTAISLKLDKARTIGEEFQSTTIYNAMIQQG